MKRPYIKNDLKQFVKKKFWENLQLDNGQAM